MPGWSRASRCVLGSMQYPCSVTVRDTMRVSSAAMAATTAAGSWAATMAPVWTPGTLMDEPSGDSSSTE